MVCLYCPFRGRLNAPSLCKAFPRLTLNIKYVRMCELEWQITTLRSLERPAASDLERAGAGHWAGVSLKRVIMMVRFLAK